MKVGDLIKFKNTGCVATVFELSIPDGKHAILFVGDGTLDNTRCSDGFTWMSLSEIKRQAEVV